MVELPYDYVSHSQLGQYLRCSKQYQLERLQRVPTPPTWYFIGGTAVHLATARLDQEPMDSWSPDRAQFLWTQAYNEGISEAYMQWPDEKEWLKAGRVSRNNKDGQGYRYWNQRGEAAVLGWMTWRLEHREEYILAAIEHEFLVDIGSHRVKGYIDRVFSTPKAPGCYQVTDLKNATKRPKEPYQLAVYKYGWEVSKELPGAVLSAGWFMCKDAALFPEPISHLTPEVLSGIFDAYLSGVEHDVFLPNIGDDCFSCTVASACGAKSGPTKEALEYDPLMKGTKSDRDSGRGTVQAAEAAEKPGDGQREGGDGDLPGEGSPERDA